MEFENRRPRRQSSTKKDYEEIDAPSEIFPLFDKFSLEYKNITSAAYERKVKMCYNTNKNDMEKYEQCISPHAEILKRQVSKLSLILYFCQRRAGDCAKHDAAFYCVNKVKYTLDEYLKELKKGGTGLAKLLENKEYLDRRRVDDISKRYVYD